MPLRDRELGITQLVAIAHNHSTLYSLIYLQSVYLGLELFDLCRFAVRLHDCMIRHAPHSVGLVTTDLDVTLEFMPVSDEILIVVKHRLYFVMLKWRELHLHHCIVLFCFNSFLFALNSLFFAL